MIAALALLPLRLASMEGPSIEAFRRPDRAGEPCSSCHTPDGYDLAIYKFPKDDLIRRAARHFNFEGQQEVVAYITDLQNKIKPTLEPMKDRFAQPGGAVLPGKTAAEREVTFLDRLSKQHPFLFGTPPKTIAEAEALCAKVLAIDVWNVPVGIEFNRLSEDHFHGAQHASIAHWIPDTSLRFPAEVQKLELAYAQSPTNANWQALDTAVLAANTGMRESQILAVSKWRSLLYVTHRDRIRRGLAPGPMLSVPPINNPLWEIGEFARTHDNLSLVEIGMPSGVVAAKSAGPSYSDQLNAMRLPWWWLGWMADPALRYSGGLGETKRADYFSMALMDEGPYPAHALFMLTRKLMEQTAKDWTRPFDFQYSFLTLSKPLIQNEPKDATAKKHFRAFARNAFVANLLLLQRDLKSRKLTVVPESQNLQMEQVRAYLKAAGMPEDKLIDATQKLMKETKVFGRYEH